MNKNHGDNDAVKREQSQTRLSSAEREHLRDQFVTGRKGTAISLHPQSPFHGISHTKRLACPAMQNRWNPDKQGLGGWLATKDAFCLQLVLISLVIARKFHVFYERPFLWFSACYKIFHRKFARKNPRNRSEFHLFSERINRLISFCFIHDFFSYS